jgi:hypothetical protein
MTYAVVAYVLSLVLWALYLTIVSRRTRREIERPRR